MGTDVPGIDQVPRLAAKDGQGEVADRSVGDDRNGGLELAGAVLGDCFGFRPRDEIDLAVEDEGEFRQASGA